MSKRALISGLTGQDGSYLADLLLEKGYTVFGLVRRTSTDNLSRIRHLDGEIELIQGDMLDQRSLLEAVERAKPDEVYNLAAQSFVGTSWQQPTLTMEINALGVVRLLEVIRQVNPRIRFYQASSSEMFGAVRETPQRETTPFYPRSPYGVSKAAAHYVTVNYRESYGLFACAGILYNHEGPRRGLEFVTKKIARGVADIAHGRAKSLVLGDLNPLRDWGYAPDYVRAMWLMLQQPEPADYVIATGETHTVREFVAAAFAAADLEWWHYVEQDPTLLRPAEVTQLCGDASLACERLGWMPSVSFRGLVGLMVQHELGQR